MIADILSIISSLSNIVPVHWVRKLLPHLTQSFITCIMLLSLYTGWWYLQDGNLTDALNDAYLKSAHSRLMDARMVDIAAAQAALRQSARTDTLLNTYLSKVLDVTKGAARARLAVIHNGTVGLGGVSLLKFDVTNEQDAGGRSHGDLIENKSLNSWTGFLPQLLNGQCVSIPFAKMAPESQARMAAIGVIYTIGIPVIDVHGQLIAAIFVSYDNETSIPTPEVQKAMETEFLTYAREMASALDLRDRP